MQNPKKILNFKNKKGVYKYIKNKFEKEAKLILLGGSAICKPLKKYSDLDFVIFSTKARKPYYEIIFIKEKPILVSIYFSRYKKGKAIEPPKNIKVLYGEYNNRIVEEDGKDTYTHKQKIKRECQLVADFCFKYFRSGDKRYLGYIQKRIK